MFQHLLVSQQLPRSIDRKAYQALNLLWMLPYPVNQFNERYLHWRCLYYNSLVSSRSLIKSNKPKLNSNICTAIPSKPDRTTVFTSFSFSVSQIPSVADRRDWEPAMFWAVDTHGQCSGSAAKQNKSIAVVKIDCASRKCNDHIWLRVDLCSQSWEKRNTHATIAGRSGSLTHVLR